MELINYQQQLEREQRRLALLEARKVMLEKWVDHYKAEKHAAPDLKVNSYELEILELEGKIDVSRAYISQWQQHVLMENEQKGAPGASGMRPV